MKNNTFNNKNMSTDNSTEISLGVISMIFYGITYFPQMYKIWKTKSSEGVSMWSVLMWAQADALSLVASILLQLDIMVVIICWYHFFMDLIMIYMMIYFEKVHNSKMISYVAIFVTINLLSNCLINILYYRNSGNEVQYLIGEVFAWVTTCIYIVGRFPQIFHLQKTIEGLSVLMFVFAIGGNASYLSLLVLQDQAMSNLAWMVLSVCLIVLDLYVIAVVEIKKRTQRTQDHQEHQEHQDPQGLSAI